MRATQPIPNYDAGITDQGKVREQTEADATNFGEADDSITDVSALMPKPNKGSARMLQQFSYDHPWIGLGWLPIQAARVVADGAGSFTVYVPDSAIAMLVSCSGIAYMNMKGRAINTPANGTVEQVSDNGAGSFLIPSQAPGLVMYCYGAKQFDVAGAAGVVIGISFFTQDGSPS